MTMVMVALPHPHSSPPRQSDNSEAGLRLRISWSFWGGLTIALKIARTTTEILHPFECLGGSSS